MNNTISDKIKNIISNHDAVLFMKGTSDSPQCGFSGAVVKILKQLGVDFTAINVMEDYEMREGIKIFTDWPTIPQLYIKGEFIGGCDIVREMNKTGELVNLLKQKNIKYAVQSI